MKFETENAYVTYEFDEDILYKVFYKVLDYFKNTEAFSGESIMQSDTALQEAPIVFSDIADEILKFEVRWKEDT